jgi:2-methylisocitrate lyase-like PEP mutase family enzyme
LTKNLKKDGLRAIFQGGHQINIIDKMQSRKRLYDLVKYEKYNALDGKNTILVLRDTNNE